MPTKFSTCALVLLVLNSALSASTLVFVDLHPAGANSSSASGVDSTGQSGTAYFASISHAAVWYGTAESFVDLNPFGADRSRAYCGGGQYQGGVAYFTNPPAYTHAALWSGSSASYVDLDPGITPNGSIIYALTDLQQGGHTPFLSDIERISAPSGGPRR
jgi:hypothetical protein